MMDEAKKQRNRDDVRKHREKVKKIKEEGGEYEAQTPSFWTPDKIRAHIPELEERIKELESKQKEITELRAELRPFMKYSAPTRNRTIAVLMRAVRYLKAAFPEEEEAYAALEPERSASYDAVYAKLVQAYMSLDKKHGSFTTMKGVVRNAIDKWNRVLSEREDAATAS